MLLDNQEKCKIISIKKYLIRNWFPIAIFILVLAFDLTILFCAKNYFSHPFINRDYIRKNGYTPALICEGWAFVNGNYYYCDENALIVKNKIINIDGKNYYLNQDGILVVNKENYTINSINYNIDKNGVITKNNE